MCHDFVYIFDTQAVKGWQMIFNWGKVAGHLSVRVLSRLCNTTTRQL